MKTTIKNQSMVLFGIILVLFFNSCATQKSSLYLKQSGFGTVLYTDKYDKISIKQPYKDGRQFSNGLAAVKKDQKWGYINSIGEIVIPFEYDWVSSFGEFGFDANIAVAKNNIDKYKMPMFTASPSWLINKKGEKITPQYGIILPLESSLALVNTGTHFQDGKNIVASEGKWGAIDSKGKVIVPCEYDLMYPFREAFTFVQKGKKWGVINAKGKVLIPCQYDQVCYLNDFGDVVDSSFDTTPSTNLQKITIPNQQKNVIYMLKGADIYLFNKKGKRMKE